MPNSGSSNDKHEADQDTPLVDTKVDENAAHSFSGVSSNTNIVIDGDPDKTLVPDHKSESGVETIKYFGDYELISEIARGGMGVVYRARQVNLNRIVAIKMILSGQLAGHEEIQRFYTEAEAAAQLDHHGIVPIYEIGEHAGQHFFSMGFVQGSSLGHEVAAGPIEPQRAARLLKEIASAMSYAHSRGVIHRDLKPSNILLDEDGNSKITDFGLAKKTREESDLTGSGQILGTPAYMPPEQAAGKVDEVGTLADIYSLGAILYCMLTGRPPFQSANPMDTLLQVLHHEVIAPRKLDPRIQLDLETICLKCLEKERSRRYSSADELVMELDRFLTGRPIEARPISRFQRALRWSKRKPSTAALIALSLVVLLTLAIAGPLIATHQRQLADAARKRQLEAEYNAYASDMLLAQRHWDNAEISQLKEILNKYQETPELRGFEWYYWQRMIENDLQTFEPHELPTTRVRFGPNGSRVASCSGNEVRVWDIASPESTLSRVIPNRGEIINDIAISTDGMQLAIAGSEGATIWSIDSDELLVNFRGHDNAVEAIVLHPDRPYAATLSRSQIKIWDTTNGNEIQNFRSNNIDYLDSLEFSQDGNLLAMLKWNGIVSLVEWRTGDVVMQNRVLGKTEEHTWCLAISPDADQLAIGMSDGTISLLDIESQQQSHTLVGHQSWVVDVAYSPDGKHLASSSDDQTVRIWDVATGAIVREYRGHERTVFSIAYNSDGTQLISSSLRVKLWDAFNNQTYANGLGVDSEASFSEFGDNVATITKDGFVKIWETEYSPWNGVFDTSPQKLSGYSQRRNRIIAVSPDGNWIAIRVDDEITGVINVQLNQLAFQVSDAIQFSPDSQYALSHSDGNGMQLWRLAAGTNVRSFPSSPSKFNAAAFHPTEESVATVHEDGTLNIWSSLTGKITRTIAAHASNHAVYSVAFSNDGSLIGTTSSDGTARIWDFESGECVHTFTGHPFVVESIAFSPDGRRVVTTSGRHSRYVNQSVGHL